VVARNRAGNAAVPKRVRAHAANRQQCVRVARTRVVWRQGGTVEGILLSVQPQ